MQEYHIRKWTIEEFEASQELWTELLHNSDNDLMFSSWEWQYSWWSECSGIDKQLQLIAIYHQEQLIALAPVFTYRKRIKGIIPIIRAQLLGCSYELTDTNRSDNIDIIVRSNCDKNKAYECISLAINNMNWDEFIIDGASIKTHIWYLTKHKQIKATFFRHKKIYNHIVKLEGSFEQYIAKLKKKVRQKAISHRRFIETTDEQRQKERSKKSNYSMVKSDDGYFFSELNRLKKIRWNKAVYDNNRLKFQQKFISYCQKNPRLQASSSFIQIDGINQSAFYSVLTAKKMYFIQFAFNPTFNSKVSLGYLHLGYAIEQSYQDNLTEIQLLPGGGKSENYKHHFANKIQPQLAYRLIKNKYLAYIFSLLSK